NPMFTQNPHICGNLLKKYVDHIFHMRFHITGWLQQTGLTREEEKRNKQKNMHNILPSTTFMGFTLLLTDLDE
ncbi:hypothetical protein ACJX0J_037737, partial [Zea mays]